MSCWRPLTLRRSRNSRGFTLLELMLVVGMMSVISTAMLSAVLWQTRLSVGQQESADAHQRARTVTAFIQNMGRQVGFGFGHAADAGGIVPIGRCTPSADPTWGDSITLPSFYTYPSLSLLVASTGECTKVDQDATSDRVRFVYLDPWLFHYSGQSKPSNWDCNASAPTNFINLSEGAYNTPFVDNSLLPSVGATLAVIGGTCNDGAPYPAAGDLVAFDLNQGGSLGSCTNSFRIWRAEDTVFTSSCETAGYAPGYKFGTGDLVDVFTADDATTRVPSLFARQVGWGPSVTLLAQYVTRFEVRYGIDTSADLTGQIDTCPSCTEDPFQGALGANYAWCRDPRGGDEGGPCAVSDSLGNVLTTRQIYNRMVALHVTFDVRSQTKQGARLAPGVTPEGYGLWTYQTLVGLRNRRSHG